MESAQFEKIQAYLSDEERLLRDWYLGFDASPVEPGAVETGTLPSAEKILRLFEDWLNRCRELLRAKIWVEWGYAAKRKEEGMAFRS